MRLSEKEYYHFLDLHHSLLLYVGKRTGIFDKTLTMEQFRVETDMHEKAQAQEDLYAEPTYIDRYLSANPDNYSDKDLAAIGDFRNFVQGTFFIFKYLKDYTVFIHQDELVYGVLALSDPFESFFGNRLPVIVEATLLPFNGQIVYDGILRGGNISIGKNYRASLNEVYKKAKARYGIITSLPFDGKTAHAGLPLDEQLRTFLKTKANRAEFKYDIQALLKKHPNLLPLYHQEWGKIHAQTHKKSLKKLGLKKAHYAILQGKIISGATSRAQLKEIVFEIVPDQKKDWVYFFNA